MAPLAEIVVQVAQGALDVGIARCPPAAPGVEARVVRLERQGVLLRRDDPRAGAPAIALADVRDEPLLLHPREANPGHYDAVLGLCARRASSPRSPAHAELDLAQTPVAAGEAVAIVGESTRAGLPADLAWVPLAPPAALEIALLVARRARSGAGDRAPARRRAEVARELDWLPAGHAAAR